MQPCEVSSLKVNIQLVEIAFDDSLPKLDELEYPRRKFVYKYTRASPDEVEKMGLNGKMVNKPYRWLEEAVAFEPRRVPWQSAVRDGLLEAGVETYNGMMYGHVYGIKLTGTIFDKNGRPHTVADLLGYADTGKLTVILHMTVEKVLMFRG